MSDNNPAGLQTIHFSAEEYSLHFFVLEKYIEYRLLLSKKRSQEIVNNTFSWLDNTNVYVYNLSPLVRYANILVFISKEGKDLLIGFNPKFLIDALRVIDDEEVTLYLMNAKAPCFIKDDEENYIYLILPVNFNAVA